MINDIQKHLIEPMYCNETYLIGSISFHRLDRKQYDPTDKLGFIVNLCSYGDYDNSCHVERANHRYLIEYATKNNLLRESIFDVSGEYGSQSVFILDTLENTELIELINSLADYPCFDDELASLVETELQDQAWESVYKSELFNDLVKSLENNENYQLAEKITEDNIYRIFNDLADMNNQYWTIECGGSAYFDIERLVNKFDSLTDQAKERLIDPDSFLADPRQENLIK